VDSELTVFVLGLQVSTVINICFRVVTIYFIAFVALLKQLFGACGALKSNYVNKGGMPYTPQDEIVSSTKL
jgi:hypothetical protein